MYRRYLNKLIGLKLLDIKHLLNLTGVVFGIYSGDDDKCLLDNSYGLQIACPWSLVDATTNEILAASGDLFSLPRNLMPIEGNLSKWQTKYTCLDEKLNKISKESMIVDKIEISVCGDLKITFSNAIEMYTFTDYSCEQYGWWFYKCGGAYTAPLQRFGLVQMTLSTSDDWWFLKFNGTEMTYCDTDMNKEESCNLMQGNVSEADRCASDLHARNVLKGGRIIEIGRKKEEKIQDAPTTWIKIELPSQDGNHKKNEIAILYFDCPFRIRNKNNRILTATADMRAVLSWDENLNSHLRKEDYFEQKYALLQTVDLVISDVLRVNRGGWIIEIGNQYTFEIFINHSTDAVLWRGYAIGKSLYYEGGKDFTERNPENENRKQRLDELEGNKLFRISRKGNYFSFLFKDSGNKKSIQLVCSQTWRITDPESQCILISGRDCYKPCTKLAGENDIEIEWNDTINTRFDELMPYLFFHYTNWDVSKIWLSKNGDLKIVFDNGLLFEHFNLSSKSQEQWQINTWMEYTDTCKDEDDCDGNNPWCQLKRGEVIPDMNSYIGTIWSLDKMVDFNRPWRLRESKTGKCMLGIVDLSVPGKNTEWVDFLENDIGNSHGEDMYNKISKLNPIIQSAEVLTNDDIIIRLSDGLFVELFL